METMLSFVEGIGIMLAIILTAVLLRSIKILKKEHSLLFSKIVLWVTLPAVIFSSLATQPFHSEFLKMAGIMAAVELAMMVLAWGIGTLLKLEKGVKGALILVSAFGMTSMLGYPIIEQVFPHNPMAIDEAVVTSEFGVAILLFILGPFIAMYFGNSNVERGAILTSAKTFLISPVFIALIAGYAVAIIGINSSNAVFDTSIRFFTTIGNANVLMVAFVIGLIVELKKIKGVVLFVVIALVLKLILKPVFTLFLTHNPDFTPMMREILLIETALPSAILAVVFAKEYDCRPDLVSLAIMVSLVCSTLTVSLLFWLFF